MDDGRPGPKYFFDQPSTGLRSAGTRHSSVHLPLQWRHGTSFSDDACTDEEEDEELTRLVKSITKDTDSEPARVDAGNTSIIADRKRTGTSHTDELEPEPEPEPAAALLLRELGHVLEEQRAPRVLPRGLCSLLSRSWRELVVGGRRPASRGQLDGAAREGHPCVRKALRKRPQVNKSEPKRSHSATPSVQDKQTASSQQRSTATHSPRTISFSMFSETHEERGWIIQPKQPAAIDSQWQAVCRQVVDRLRQQTLAIKEQTAKLEEQGFTKAVFLHHYGDIQGGTVQQQQQQQGLTAWNHPFVLRCGHPRVPQVTQDSSSLQKLHYGINDGTSFIYYPSGRIAVCQSHSALPQGGFYTNVFADVADPPILASFTAFGRGSVTHALSGTLRVVWDQHGGVMCDPCGTITNKWTWSPGTKPIFIQVTEVISVRVLNSTSATLSFKGQKSIQLPVISLPKVAKEVELLEMDPVDRRAQHTNQELCGLQKRVRKTVNSWLEHYRAATGICCHEAQKMCCSHQQMLLEWQVQAASLPSLSTGETEPLNLGPPPGGNTEDQTTTPHPPAPAGSTQLDPKNCSEEPRVKTSGKLKKEDLQYITATGPLRVYSNIKLDPVQIPKRPETPHPSPGLISNPCSLPIPCPSLLRATMLGDRRRGLYCCTGHRMPLLTDLEYDTFMLSQASRANQVLVVCVTPSTLENVLDELYEKTNRKRSKPCSQCHLDSFRLVRYESSRNALLCQRHSVAPGMLLMYLEGKLLFADYMFKGHGCSVKELQKQIARRRAEFYQGHCSTPHFTCSPAAAQQSAGLSTPKTDCPAQRVLPALSTKKNLRGAQSHAPSAGFSTMT